MTASPVFFFMHVMKTGGTSIVHHIQDNFPVGTTEPDYRTLPPDEPVPEAHYASLVRLWELGDDDRARIRLYMGHYPYWVTELVRPDVTFTVLRDPVDRTISMLRQLSDEDPPDARRPLEAIYDDDATRSTMIQDYQAKVLGMSRDDWDEQVQRILMLNPTRQHAGHLAHLMSIPVDHERLARAKANLARIDLLGLQHEMGELLDALRTRYGWSIPLEHRHRCRPDRSGRSPGSGVPVPHGLVGRLTARPRVQEPLGDPVGQPGEGLDPVRGAGHHRPALVELVAVDHRYAAQERLERRRHCLGERGLARAGRPVDADEAHGPDGRLGAQHPGAERGCLDVPGHRAMLGVER